MERKNTVLLTVIAVATLLVAVVGATFAYFTATNNNGTTTGAGTDNVMTATLGDTTFTFEGKSLTKSYLDYPGGLAVFGSKASLVKGGSDTNNYSAKFDLEIEYENQTGTDLYWALYMVESGTLDESLDPECKIKNKVVVTETHFWYGDESDEEEGHSCTLTETQKQTLQSSDMIAYGTFKSSHPKGTIDSSSATSGATTEDYSEVSPSTCEEELCNPKSTTDNPLKGRELNTSDTPNKSYYLVVQYPNKNSDQTLTGDEGKAISVNLRVKSGTIVVTANGAQGAQTTEE